ncbi:MAG: Uma2 family endonuclease [Candidatus Competibacteraceae bacterium]
MQSFNGNRGKDPTPWLSRHWIDLSIPKRLLYERYRVLEYWLVHPTDRLVTIYRLNIENKYNQAGILETRGRQTVGILPELEIDWDMVFRNL